MYVHLTARSRDGLLFHDWTEALALWRRLVAAFPEARAACLMPNHTHVVTEDDNARPRMSGVMSGYARWRGHHRRQDGRCWEPQPAVETLPDADHLRRTVRYVLLNPCRAELVGDPLAWPLSTHRDLVGLGDPALRVRDPHGLHAYVSADPTVSVVGTELPLLATGPAPLAEIAAAVGAVLRMQPAEVRADPRARRLCVRAAWFRENTDPEALAAWIGIARSHVYRMVLDLPGRSRLDAEPLLSAVLRVTGDPRFGPLELRPRANPTTWAGWRLG